MRIQLLVLCYLLPLFLTLQTACGQSFFSFTDTSLNTKWIAGLTSGWDFKPSGYLKVRENQYEGDKLSFSNDLGVSSLYSTGISVGRKISHASSITFSFRRYFFLTNPVITKNIWFNGTHFSGSNGISLSRRSTWNHLSLQYQKQVELNFGFQLGVGAGLVYDGIKTYINGTILRDTYHIDPTEDFDSQALPYPNLEVSFLYPLGSSQLNTASGFGSAISFGINATATPLFKSFFQEGGQISLKYSCINSELSYLYLHRHLIFKTGLSYHQLRTFEESTEDTNDLKIGFFGINLLLGYSF